MGNSDSTLGLDNLHVDRTNCQVYNDWTLASGDLDGLPIVVFSATHPATSKKRPYMERALQASRVYRHPGLLRYVAGGVVGGGSGEVVMVMEESMPLQHCHQTLSPLQVIAGLTSIVKTLVFLHDTAGVSHNNLSKSSIFVTPDQSWKLWGLEYSCSFSDLNHRHLAQIQSFCHESALPPDDTSRIVPAYQHARDAYSFANLVEDLLMRYPAIGDVPGAEDFILLLRREAQHREWNHRPRFEALQQHALFQHTFLRIHHHLSTLLLMPDTDRETFLSGLVFSLRQYPEAVVACSLARALLARPVLLVPKAALAILPAVLTPRTGSEEPSSPALVGGVEGLFSEVVFSEHIVPRVAELYSLHDLPIRELILEYLPSYLHLIPKDVLKDEVLPEVLLGIQDCSEALVCRSLRALAVLVPVLGADCVVGQRRHAIFAAIQPKAAPSTPDQRGVPRHSLAKPSLAPHSPRKGWEGRVSPIAVNEEGRETELNGRSSPDGGEDFLSGGTSVGSGFGSSAISGTLTDHAMNLEVLLEGQRSPGRGSSEGGIEGRRVSEILAKDSLENKQGQNDERRPIASLGGGDGEKSRLIEIGSKEGCSTAKQHSYRFNKHSDTNHSILDNVPKEIPKRTLGFKHGGVGFNEIFGNNAEDSDEANSTSPKEDLVANFLLGSENQSEVKISSVYTSGRETTKSLFDPETASASEGNSDEGADWSDWDDVNGNDNIGTDFTAALSSLNGVKPTTRGVSTSETNHTEPNGETDSVFYGKEFASRLDQSADRSKNGSIRDMSSGQTAGRLEASSTISENNREKSLSSNVNRNVSAGKGLGEEFDISSIEVKKMPDTEENWFADLAPNLNHKKFDLEQLLEEANAKSKFTLECVVAVSEQHAIKTSVSSSERSVRLQDEHILVSKLDADTTGHQLGDSRLPSDEGRDLRQQAATGTRDKLPSVSDTMAQCLDRDSEGQGWDNESDGGWTDQLNFEDSGSPVKNSEFEDFSSQLESAKIEGLLHLGEDTKQIDESVDLVSSIHDADLISELHSVQVSQNDVQIDDVVGFEEIRPEHTSDVNEQLHHCLTDLTKGKHSKKMLESVQDSMRDGESIDDQVQDSTLKETWETSDVIEQSLSSMKGQNKTDSPIDCNAPKCELLSDLVNVDANDDR